MKKDRLLNPAIVASVAALGHTEMMCIADCGLPIPEGTKTIDISVTAGLPGFLDVLKTVMSELVVESAIVASEIDAVNPGLMADTQAILGDIPVKRMLHEEFKKQLTAAKCVIRTGETSSYANVLLVGGVNF